MNLFKPLELPDAVEVDGSLFFIHTDFRYWIEFARLIKTPRPIEEYNFFYLDDIPENKADGFQKLIEFYSPKKEYPRPTSSSSNEIVLDFEIDADLIFSAFMEQYQIDIMDIEVNMHWHKFNALLSSLHDTKLNDVISYRSYNPEDKTDYKTQMQNLKNAWKLPQPIDAKTQSDLDYFNSLFD